MWSIAAAAVPINRKLTNSSSEIFKSGALMASSSSEVYQTPIGPLKLVASKDGISAVKYLFGKHTEEPVLVKEAPVMVEEKAGEKTEADAHLDVCKKWLDWYFKGFLLKPDSAPPLRPTLALSMEGEIHSNVLILIVVFL